MHPIKHTVHWNILNIVRIGKTNSFELNVCCHLTNRSEEKSPVGLIFYRYWCIPIDSLQGLLWFGCSLFDQVI